MNREVDVVMGFHIWDVMVNYWFLKTQYIQSEIVRDSSIAIHM